MIPIEFKVLDERLFAGRELAPATQGSAAIDLYAMIDCTIALHPKSTIILPTGFAVHIKDPNYAGLILPRSGLGTKHGIILANSVGLIDSDYQGEIKVALYNRSGYTFPIEFGMRIAQLMLIPVQQIGFKQVLEFSPTERGDRGFGSTGV